MNTDHYKLELREFTQDRNWDQFHTPKNLSMALSVEASELVEIFQWLTPNESQNPDLDTLFSVMDEVADIYIYLIRLCDKLNIDLEFAIDEKLKKNAEKYPIEKSKNNAIKYNKLDSLNG